MDELFHSLRRRANEFRKRFEAGVKDDLQRSKSEARALLDLGTRFAIEVARETSRIGEELRVEVKVESNLVLRHLQQKLMSEELEQRLDAILERAGQTETFKTAEVKEAAWFSRLHDSLYSCPIEGLDEESTRERRDRIAQKLNFLFQHYRDNAVDFAAEGSLLNGFMGPGSKLRFASVAGGMKLIMVLGGVTYSVLVNEKGEWSLA